MGRRDRENGDASPHKKRRRRRKRRRRSVSRSDSASRSASREREQDFFTSKNPHSLNPKFQDTVRYAIKSDPLLKDLDPATMQEQLTYILAGLRLPSNPMVMHLKACVAQGVLAVDPNNAEIRQMLGMAPPAVVQQPPQQQDQQQSHHQPQQNGTRQEDVVYRRLAVSNLPADCSGQEMAEVFEREIQQLAGPDLASPAKPAVTNVQLNVSDRSCFVEFSSHAVSQVGLALDGFIHREHRFEVRRPKEFCDAPKLQHASDKVWRLAGVVSTQVAESSSKLYIGSLPQELNDTDVMELINSFGALASFNLHHSQGHAFFQYRDPNNVYKALQSLNGMVIAEKTLHVCLASEAPQTSNNSNTSGQSSTAVISLTNMVVEEELRDQAEYDDIVDDIRTECSKYGQLREVRIPRNGPGVGKVFLHYESASDAERAFKALNGREFASRIVQAAFIALADFQAGQL